MMRPSDDLDPFHDAVGKFVHYCQAMEVFLRLALAELTPGMTHQKAEMLGASKVVTKLRTRGDALLDQTGRELLGEALDKASEVLSLRNAVVHGFWSPAPGGRWSDRLSVHGAAENIRVYLSREDLIDACAQASGVAGVVQSNLGPWMELLDEPECDGA